MSSGVMLREEAVHHLAPGPEAVVVGAAPLGESGHARAGKRGCGRWHAGDGDAAKRWLPAVAAPSGALAVMVRALDGDRAHRGASRRPTSACATWIAAMDRCLVALMLCRAALRTLEPLCIDITNNAASVAYATRSSATEGRDAGGSALDAMPGSRRSIPHALASASSRTARSRQRDGRIVWVGPRCASCRSCDATGAHRSAKAAGSRRA